MSGQGSSFSGIPVTITNKLSVPLDIYDVHNPAATGQTAPFVYTKLGTVAAGATGTVTTIHGVSLLEAMYTGTIQELQGWYYYQFPIKFMSGTQVSYDDPPIAYTITESDRQSMIESFLFHKFAMANPDSALTKNLNAALKQTDPKAVNAFFASTQNFKNCTLSSWNAIMTWLTMFTSPWQGPYYLYEAAPSSPPQGYVPALVATLNIASSASDNSAKLVLCTEDSTGNLRPVNPPASSTLGMAGDGTMVDQNPGQDLSVTLTPVWMNTIQTTMNGKQPVTSYISGPTLTGTVAGKKVVSTQTLIPLPSQSQSGKSGTSSSGQMFGTICQVVGLIVGLVMLYEIAEKRLCGKQEAEEQAKREATSEPDYEDRIDTLDSETASDISRTFTEDSDFDQSAEGVSEGYSQISRTEQTDVLTESLDSEMASLDDEIRTQLEDGLTPTDAFDEAVGNARESFGEARQQIENGQLPEASSTMSEAGTSMQQTLDQSAADMQQSEVESLRSSADAVSNAAEQADSLNEAQEKYEENMDNETNDSGAPDEDVSPETEDIPDFVG